MASGPSERGIRNLNYLMTANSSSRVFNPARVHSLAEMSGAPLQPPLFQRPALNKCLLVKRRLGADETALFATGRATATKIVIPIDYSNLGIGGRSVFIDQINFEKMIGEVTGIDDVDGSPDVVVMRELDRVPSFDPFILKMWLSRQGVHPDERYFELAPSVAAEVEETLFDEIGLLVSMSLSGSGTNQAILNFTRNLLSGQDDDDLAPLQQTLRMTKAQFDDGMFGWKGFLYYRWLAKRIEADLPHLIEGISSIRPRRHITQDQIDSAADLVKSIAAVVTEYFDNVSEKIRTYDVAFRQLTRKQDPVGLRSFLLEAPDRFLQMGEYVGLLEHLVEFWRFRSATIESLRFTGDDYIDLILDLRDGLGA